MPVGFLCQTNSLSPCREQERWRLKHRWGSLRWGGKWQKHEARGVAPGVGTFVLMASWKGGCSLEVVEAGGDEEPKTSFYSLFFPGGHHAPWPASSPHHGQHPPSPCALHGKTYSQLQHLAALEPRSPWGNSLSPGPHMPL